MLLLLLLLFFVVGSVEFAYYLLRHGASLDATDSGGRTPLVVCAIFGAALTLAQTNMLACASLLCAVCIVPYVCCVLCVVCVVCVVCVCCVVCCVLCVVCSVFCVIARCQGCGPEKVVPAQRLSQGYRRAQRHCICTRARRMEGE